MRYEKAAGSENKLAPVIKALVWGVLVGAVVCMVLLLAFSFVFSRVPILPGDNILDPLVVIVCGLSALFGAYVTGRILRVKGMLYGIFCGLLLFAVVFIANLSAVHEPLSFLSLVKGLLMVLMGAVGGIWGVNRHVKRKK